MSVLSQAISSFRATCSKALSTRQHATRVHQRTAPAVLCGAARALSGNGRPRGSPATWTCSASPFSVRTPTCPLRGPAAPQWPHALSPPVIISPLPVPGWRRRSADLLGVRCLNTFLPLPDFTQSVQVLDRQRLGKQRVEAWQILNVVEGRAKSGAWRNHPMVRMWRGYSGALTLYYNACLREWEWRGYRNILLQPLPADADAPMPLWLGDERVHGSHRSNLLRKAPEHYSQFGWREAPGLPYYWPVPPDAPPAAPANPVPAGGGPRSPRRARKKGRQLEAAELGASLEVEGR